MSESTKGFVATNQKDVWEISQIIRGVLETRPRESSQAWNKRPNASQNAKFELSMFGRFFTVNFQDGKDHRQLFVFFDCDCDQNDVYSGEKLSSL